MAGNRRVYVAGPIWTRFDACSRESISNRGSVTGSRWSVLGIVVLAAATVARFPSGHDGHSTLAMVGCASLGAGICGCPALRLGLRMDGTRYPRDVRSAATLGRGRSIPPCSEPHVPGSPEVGFEEIAMNSSVRSAGVCLARAEGARWWREQRGPVQLSTSGVILCRLSSVAWRRRVCASSWH